MAPLGRLAVVVAALLLSIGQAKIHTSLRGGNSTAVDDSDDVNLVNEEVDDSLAGGSGLDIGADEDPESVYDATLADQQMKADLAAHGVQILDEAAPREISSVSSVAMNTDASSDVESVYEAVRRAGLNEHVLASHKAAEKAAATKKIVAAAAAKIAAAVGKPKETASPTAAAKPRAARIKQLIAAAASKAVKDVKKAAVVKDVKKAVVVKDVKKAVVNKVVQKAVAVKDVKKAAVAPVPKVHMQVRTSTKKANTVVGKPHLQKDNHAKANATALNHRGLHNSAMDAAAKIVERGRKASSGLGNKDEVGIVADGEEAATTDDESSDADDEGAASSDDGSSDADRALEEGAEVEASEEANDGTDDDSAADEQIADGEADEAQDEAEE